MILAAGLGTRLKPFTDKHPKALAVVNNKTLLQRNIEYLQSFGITEVIVNVHHFADQIITLLKTNAGFGSNVTISDEQEEVLETGEHTWDHKQWLAFGELVFLLQLLITHFVSFKEGLSTFKILGKNKLPLQVVMWLRIIIFTSI